MRRDIRNCHNKNRKTRRTNRRKDGKIREERRKYTITIPVGEITRDIKYIDVIADQATATKGERGFFVLGDSSYGTFKYDNGTYTPRYCHMPIFE